MVRHDHDRNYLAQFQQVWIRKFSWIARIGRQVPRDMALKRIRVDLPSIKDFSSLFAVPGNWAIGKGLGN